MQPRHVISGDSVSHCHLAGTVARGVALVPLMPLSPQVSPQGKDSLTGMHLAPDADPEAWLLSAPEPTALLTPTSPQACRSRSLVPVSPGRGSF